MTNVYSREFHTLCSSENKNGNRKLYSIDFCLSKFRHVFFFCKKKRVICENALLYFDRIAQAIRILAKMPKTCHFCSGPLKWYANFPA